MHGALGRGTNAWLRKGKDKVPLRRNGLGLPFVGPTWSNHFMFSCMLRTKKFKKDPKVLDDLVLAFAEDMQELLLNGVTTADGRITIRCCHLGTKGDLPALAKLGRMKHTFSNCPRASTTKNPCEGICWMCLGGQEETADGSRSAVPFEEMSGQPLWEATLGQQDNWDAAPPILHGVPLVEGEQWSFFKTDVWHNFHLGVAKHWLASAFVCAIETSPFLGHLSVDDQISWLDARYKEFYKRKKISPHVTEIGRDTLSWPQSSTCPIGNWNKGAASTHFMQFLESLCTQYKTDFANDDLLDTIASWMDFEKVFMQSFVSCLFNFLENPGARLTAASLQAVGTTAMNTAIASLYSEGVFIRRDRAERIGKFWLLFLQKYSMAARLVYAKGKSRFAIVPKLHMLHHGALKLLREAEKAHTNGTLWTSNPLSESVQMQEDYIGRPSRLSRRVNPQQIHARVCQRSLISTLTSLKAADKDRRGLFSALATTVS